MDFISFIDSWIISSPWIISCYKMIIVFCRVKFLALQNEDWFLSSKNQAKKHLLQNDKPGVCNKMHFTSPFFFYQFRVRWHSVVSISSPFLWWKIQKGMVGVHPCVPLILTPLMPRSRSTMPFCRATSRLLLRGKTTFLQSLQGKQR